MNKVGIVYFLIFMNIFILTYKYLNEAPIIENFYENEPKLSIDELRILSKIAHSFVNGEPLKVTHNIIAPKLYIGNVLIDAHIDNLRVNHITGKSALIDDVTQIEFGPGSIIGKPPNDLVLESNSTRWGVTNNPLNLSPTDWIYIHPTDLIIPTKPNY